MDEQERCPECGRWLTESHEEFLNQWEPDKEEVCYPYVNFGGSQLCSERVGERLKSELAAARTVIDAAEAMRDYLTVDSFIDLKQRANVTAFDAALAEWRRTCR